MYRRYSEFLSGPGAVALLIVRIIAGTGLMMHGYPKIQHPFDWMGAASGIPGFLQALSAVTEFGGGLFLILGLLTPIVALLLICNFLVALAVVHLPHGDPFVAMPGKHSYESALDYLGFGILFLLIGPGDFSIDAALFSKKLTAPRATGKASRKVRMR